MVWHVNARVLRFFVVEEDWHGGFGNAPRDARVRVRFLSWANGLNDRDFVVGGSWYDAERNHAFLWTRGDGMEDLGVPAGFVGSSDAYGINASGLVVGTASEGVVEGAAPHAFLWTRLAGMTLLESARRPV